MSSEAIALQKQDYKVADISLAEWGRKEISIAETEMPALTLSRPFKERWTTSIPSGSRVYKFIRNFLPDSQNFLTVISQLSKAETIWFKNQQLLYCKNPMIQRLLSG